MSGGLIVAAPASGSGKTLVTLALLHGLRRAGFRVAAAKAGPDYIDPSFHALASGAPCLNLDPWAMRPAMLAGLVGGLERGADIVVCEGVMGLFDGTGTDGETGSTADLARRTGWPVVLVVDAKGQGASAAALVAGFARHDPGVAIAGVIFNRVAGARHRAVLEAAVARHLPDLPCLGAVPADPALVLPARHLGLVPATEAAPAAATAETAAAGLDISGLAALARPSLLAGGEPAAPLPPLGQRIAVARDDAFAFAYPAVLDGWRRQGAQVTLFSPLADEAPDGDAVYLPGGYPELHAGKLAGAANFREGLRRAASSGAAIYAECGGYMVLGEALEDLQGITYEMAGVLPLTTSFAERRLHLGYREARLTGDAAFGQTGARFRGHEFHYATIQRERGAEPLFDLRDASGKELGACGLRVGRVAGSFIHLIDRMGD
ncbi:MAG TPA: cobyrinate a,c-diamide synthase [Stellaceae bacterium]|nr:cobyrinate a,c-diamide synthase [Stellaceae bacterium]